MNNNLAKFIDIDSVIGLILKFSFEGVIDLGREEKQEALKFRLVCKKFKNVFDRLVHLSIYLPIRNRRKCYCPLNKISSVYIFSDDEITEEDWEDIFGDKLDNVASSLENLHVEACSIEYLPKFKYLKSILWEVDRGCYDLLKEIPHNDLIITRYIIPSPSHHGSIAHLTRLSEIKISIWGSFDHKLVNKHLPSTILRMTISMGLDDVADVIDLSKFRSLEYLKIEAHFNEQLIEELILPPSLYEFYSSVKIKKMNLHECKKLEVLELKLKRKRDRKWDITIPYLPNLYELRLDNYGGSYSIDTRTLMRIESLTVVINPQRNTQWSVEFDGLDSYIKTNCATKLIPVCSNLEELMMEFKYNTVERNNNHDIRNLVIILDIKNEYLNYITGVGFGGIAVAIKSHRQIEYIDIDTDELNVIHE